MYDNPYSCNVKDEPEEDNKQQPGKKRKYNKTGKYKKNPLDPYHDNAENVDGVRIFFITSLSEFRESSSIFILQSCKSEPKAEVSRAPRMVSPSVQIRNKLKKKALQVQVMTARRRKLWALMIKKEICKVTFLIVYEINP